MRTEAKKSPEFRFKALTQEEKQAQYDSYINGIDAQAFTKTRTDENFLRKRLEMPTLPEDHPVAGEGSQAPLRLVRQK
jgi:hypothetical protein